MRWTFSPFSPNSWGTGRRPGALPRVLLVGSEPNGDNPRGLPDMGDWFRTAHADARRLGNARFYNRCMAQLGHARAALGSVLPEGSLEDLRYADLKAEAGTGTCSADEILWWVSSWRDAVLRLWLPLPGDPAAPDVTVIQGSPAQEAFVAAILPTLRARGVRTRFVGMAHPSSMSAHGTLDADAVAASMRPLDEGFGAWRYRAPAWRWNELFHPRWRAPARVAMPGRHLSVFVATRPEEIRTAGPFASVDGSVGGATTTWDHHVTGERINLDAMPARIDPRRFTGVGTTLADTDALASVVALRAGGEANLPGDVATVLRAASERCDHLVARDGVPDELQRAADALHRHVEQALAAAGDDAQSGTFARLCDEVTIALASGSPLPAAGVDPRVAGLQRRIVREGRLEVRNTVALLDVRGLPDLPADALHALHEAPVAVVLRDHPRGGVSYTVGVNPRVAPSSLDLGPALHAIAVREHAHGAPVRRPEPGPGSENWGGRRTVFGSPWNFGSRVGADEVVACVQALFG